MGIIKLSFASDLETNIYFAYTSRDEHWTNTDPQGSWIKFYTWQWKGRRKAGWGYL